ncbi:MAG: YbaB/EbfC family nucleoid-associated protein [Tissierellia bacterium]|nr:YbaB/EbfC family nucleoid-associated protein [Tissierellia bacterium]
MAKFRGRGGMPNMNNMMKQMQKMQRELEKSQQEMEERIFTASAGGGSIEIKANGKNEILEVKIDPDVVDSEDMEMLEDLILVAVNDVLNKIEDENQKQVGKLTGGMNIPGL